METLKALLIKRFEYNCILLNAKGKKRKEIQSLANEINMKILKLEG